LGMGAPLVFEGLLENGCGGWSGFLPHPPHPFVPNNSVGIVSAEPVDVWPRHPFSSDNSDRLSRYEDWRKGVGPPNPYSPGLLLNRQQRKGRGQDRVVIQ